MPSFPFGDMPGMNNPFASMTVTVDLNGWQGRWGPGSLSVPNWFVVVLAIAVCALVWLKASGAWRAPKTLAYAMIAFALVQTVSTLIALAFSGKSTVGIGIVLAVASFVWMGVAVYRFFQLPTENQRPDDLGAGALQVPNA